MKRVLLLSALLFPTLAGSKVAVITHPTDNNNQLSYRDLQRIYHLEEAYWSDGTVIKPVVLQDSSKTHKQFVTRYMRKSVADFRAVIDKNPSRYFRARNSARAAEYVSAWSGAIGYGNHYIIVNETDAAFGENCVTFVTITD